MPPIVHEFSRVKLLSDVNSCLTSLRRHLSALNTSVYKLPPAFSSVADISTILGALDPSLQYLNSQVRGLAPPLFLSLTQFDLARSLTCLLALVSLTPPYPLNQ